jgi:hypothetical protein
MVRVQLGRVVQALHGCIIDRLKISFPDRKQLLHVARTFAD